jgi:hypothetical protein
VVLHQGVVKSPQHAVAGFFLTDVPILTHVVTASVATEPR